MSDKNQRNIGKLVARYGDQYVVCQYFFDYHDGLKGVVGSSFRPVPKEEYDARRTLDSLAEEYRDHWQEAVKDGRTELGLTEWVDAFSDDDLDGLWDDSYSEFHDQIRALGFTEEEYPVIECTGGGRMFHATDEYDEVYDEDLLAEIYEVEGATA